MLDTFKKLFFRSKPLNNNHTHRILVVEDGELDRKLIVKTVEKMGYTVFDAVNGEEGFKMALAKRPHLILMDCEMPQLRGPDMCRLLKENQNTENIPVLFITGSETPKNVVDCFDVEPAGYLSKPINFKTLSNQIESILQEHSAQ